jgi:hypothetical protein
LFFGVGSKFPENFPVSRPSSRILQEAGIFPGNSPCFLKPIPDSRGISRLSAQSSIFSCKTAASCAKRQLPVQGGSFRGKTPSSLALSRFRLQTGRSSGRAEARAADGGFVAEIASFPEAWQYPSPEKSRPADVQPMSDYL